MKRTAAGSCVLYCAVLSLLAGWAVGSDPETRRQVGSEVIDRVYNLDGTGVNIGQIELNEPLAHTNVPFIGRGGAGTSTSLHALEVAGIMVSDHATYKGMAPGATLWSDDYTNNGIPGTSLGSDNNVLDALRYLAAVDPVEKIVNASFGWGSKPADPGPPPVPAVPAVPSTGLQKVTLGIDWRITEDDFLFVKSAGNEGDKIDHHITVPGDAYNGLAVGDVIRSKPDGPTSTYQGPVANRWDILDLDSSYESDNGIPKPDLVAPGGRKRYTSFNMATATGGFAVTNHVGTSYAAPHVSGVAAQLYQLQSDSNHRTMKAALMNATDKTVRDRLGDAWTAGSNGLDNQLGTGQLDGWGSAVTLAAGAGGRIGESTGGAASGATVFYLNNTPIGPDSRVVATVTWDRVVERDTTAPNGNPPNEVYTEAANQPHMKLEFAGTATFTQNSAGGSVQHINQVTTPAQAGNYTLSIGNNGAGSLADFSVAWAISPVDVNPGKQKAFFTVSDQIHERTGQDRILEGRPGTAIRGEAAADATGGIAGVESDVWSTTMDVTNGRFADGRTNLGLNENAGFLDDAINALSFGRDDLPTLVNEGGSIYFSVDEYATGLSYYGLGNPNTNGVLDEATVVNEAAGDVFISNKLLPGAGALQNANLKTKNQADSDFLHPAGQVNLNKSFADSYYMGQTGPRVADNEDDLTGLEGLGGVQRIDTSLDLTEGFLFFSLDRDSPSGHTGDVLVSDMKGKYDVYATSDQLGILSTDNLDALLLMDLGGLGDKGLPVYDPAIDWLVFSVDRDSQGAEGSAVKSEWGQGEVPGDLFWASTAGSNLLFLEATDLGLQEVPLGEGASWLSDNLDALDIPDVSCVPEPSTLISLGLLVAIFFRGLRWRRRRYS